MRVYACHQFGGNPSNVNSVETKLRNLLRFKYQMFELGITFVSPLHALGFAYPLVDWEHGMQMCFDLLSTCEYMLTFGDLSMSRGCMLEKEYCKEHGIPIIEYDLIKDGNLIEPFAIAREAKEAGLILGAGQPSIDYIRRAMELP